MMKRIAVSCLLYLVCMMLWSENSPYISRVYTYCPAPGQFVNTMPEYEEGDDAEAMRIKADEAIVNHAQGMISLGGWGGYVVFGFDHEVLNVDGAYDLKILGNSFFAASNPNPEMVGKRGGSSEPGIVMVSRDENMNGRPDDTWYELAGSEYYKATTRHNYMMTYRRPASTHVATPNKSYPYLVDTTYIAWYSSEGEKGYLSKNSFHKQDYYPKWIAEDTIRFAGTIMPGNSVDESGNGSYYVSYCFDYGYVDDLPNEVASEPDLHASEFKLDWAVDADGQKVNLSGIHFVKVYTGLNEYRGWLGECSTEIMDAWDLHPEAQPTGLENGKWKMENGKWQKRIENGQLVIVNGEGKRYGVL